ncbi:hypothetical protein [Priestia megaterium]|uniref:hypothetical protein n=1 Tax=Priestia megaterium TaxID=1404 RepID=UPI0010E6B88B|nr:hypothetical protein [Priestia megaterium]TCN05978.1 hypothetical protein EV581_11198 [Bacillus sp. BK006]
MSDKEREEPEIEKPSLDRAGIRYYMGNPEKFEFSLYGVLMACVPLIIVGIFIWYNW